MSRTAQQNCGQLHDMKIQYLIKKIPCLDFWNHMISRAKHQFKLKKKKKKNQFCMQGMEEEKKTCKKVLVGKEIKMPVKVSIKV